MLVKKAKIIEKIRKYTRTKGITGFEIIPPCLECREITHYEDGIAFCCSKYKHECLNKINSGFKVWKYVNKEKSIWI